MFIFNLFKLRGEHSQFGADKREKKGKKIDSDVVDIGDIYHPHFGLEINTKRPHCFAENRSPWLLGPFRWNMALNRHQEVTRVMMLSHVRGSVSSIHR